MIKVYTFWNTSGTSLTKMTFGKIEYPDLNGITWCNAEKIPKSRIVYYIVCHRNYVSLIMDY